MAIGVIWGEIWNPAIWNPAIWEQGGYRYTFTPQPDVPTSTVVTSNSVTVIAADDEAVFSVSGTGGEISFNGGAWQTASEIVNTGYTVRLRHTSSGSNSTAVSTTLTSSNLGVVGVFTSTTAAASDTTPDAFSFTDQTNVSQSATITSAAVTITGIDTTVSFTATGGTIDVNADGNFQTSRDVVNNDAIRARHTSSASYATPTNTTVAGGGVSDVFTSTTLGDPSLAKGSSAQSFLLFFKR